MPIVPKTLRKGGRMTVELNEDELMLLMQLLIAKYTEKARQDPNSAPSPESRLCQKLYALRQTV
jgi:hypothetical protein